MKHKINNILSFDEYSTRASKYDPQDTITTLYYKNSSIEIGFGTIVIEGDIKDVAFCLSKYLSESSDGAPFTHWTDIVKAYHSKDRCELEFLGKDKPLFFDELNENFKKFYNLKSFL